jgi:DNA-binding response OmpR family regulator
VNPRVLIALDTRLVRWSLCQAFQPLGVDIVLAASRDQALELALDGPFDFVVMACCLGEQDMADVLAPLAHHAVPGGVVVLAEEGWRDRHADLEPLALIVQKPFAVEDVVAAARRALERPLRRTRDGGRLGGVGDLTHACAISRPSAGRCARLRQREASDRASRSDEPQHGTDGGPRTERRR